NADTTVSEERALREYFRSGNVPAHLQKYSAMFGAMECLTADADAPKAKKPGRVVRFYRSLYPLFRAAACVAIILTVAMAAEQGMSKEEETTVLTPANSQTVGTKMSEWDGAQSLDTPTDSLLNVVTTVELQQ
ncbi:MAG: hypothetical protein HUK00_04430, partial [Bacteroidaceae bacterium]|nr:hypothetical protein [Bacteroidaceae bacterium]